MINKKIIINDVYLLDNSWIIIKNYINLKNPPIVIDLYDNNIYKYNNGTFTIIKNDIISDYIQNYQYNFDIRYCGDNVYILTSQLYKELLFYMDSDARIKFINIDIEYKNFTDSRPLTLNFKPTPYITYRSCGVVDYEGIIQDLTSKQFDYH